MIEREDIRAEVERAEVERAVNSLTPFSTPEEIRFIATERLIDALEILVRAFAVLGLPAPDVAAHLAYLVEASRPPLVCGQPAQWLDPSEEPSK